jgi:hypothetical protein
MAQPLDVYSHVLPGPQEAAATAIQAALGEVAGRVGVGKVWATLRSERQEFVKPLVGGAGFEPA